MVGFLKSHTRIRWTALVLVLSLVLAACGGAQTTPTPTTAPTRAETPTAIPEEPTPEETTSPETEESEATEESEETPTDAPAEESTDEMTEEAAGEEATESTEGAETEGEATTVEGATVSVTQINTSLRSGPGTAYEVVLQTSVSETFPVIARFGEGSRLWYQVLLDDGMTAWVWSRVATLNPPDAEIPVADDVPPAP